MSSPAPSPPTTPPTTLTFPYPSSPAAIFLHSSPTTSLYFATPSSPAAPLLTPPPPSSSSPSLSQILLQERQRKRASGISSYDYHAPSRLLLVAYPSGLYLATLPAALPSPSTPLSLTALPTPPSPMDAKLSPDGKWVSFIHENNVYVTSPEREPFAVTHAESPLMAGVPDYITAEEFDRYTGYWWSPDSTRIAYLEVDESEVPRVTIDSTQYRFPRPGERNATMQLRVVTVASGETFTLPFAAIPSWVEYIPRVCWAPDSSVVYMQLLSRDQKRFELVSVAPPSTDLTTHHAETSSCWINIDDIFTPLKNSAHAVISSERTGFRHLYLLDLATSSLTPITAAPLIVHTSAITVDEENAVVYFSATSTATPTESHFYRTALHPTEDSAPTRLTPAGFHCESFALSPTFSHLAFTYSNVSTPPATDVLDLAASTTHTVFSTPPKDSLPTPPTLFTLPTTDGTTTLHACVFMPDAAAHPPPSTGYPTLIYTYGGPHVQLVRNAYSLASNRRHQRLASEGYVVAIVDGRGSFNRGLEFEGHLHHRMGQVEIEDQVALVEHLVRERKCTDPARVAITGWSYGGYMTLLAMSQRPDVFKLGISGAPVTFWEAYDTGYTERYMDTPERNPDGYKKGSVLHYAANFPDEENRVVIAHGLIDENVHFTHTAELVDELIKLDKPYVLKIFPRERHGFRSPAASRYFEKFFFDFLTRHL